MTMHRYLMVAGVMIVVAITVSAALVAEQESEAEADDSTWMAGDADAVLFADDSQAVYDDSARLSEANYESGWVEVASDQTTNIIFYAGFRPRLVSVLAQMRGCEGVWRDVYSFVPPAHTSWDDMYTNGENVYWLRGNEVVVHHEGVIRGTNIHDGCAAQRFKVYAWN